MFRRGRARLKKKRGKRRARGFFGQPSTSSIALSPCLLPGGIFWRHAPPVVAAAAAGGAAAPGAGLAGPGPADASGRAGGAAGSLRAADDIS